MYEKNCFFLVAVTSPVTHCSNIMEQAIGTVGLPTVHKIVFRGVQIECGYGGSSVVKLTTVI